MSNQFSKTRQIFACLFVLFLAAPISFAQEDATKDGPSLSQESETSAPASAEPSFTRKLLFNGESPTSIVQLRELEKHFAQLSKKVKPAVVNIQIKGAQGSGVVVSEDGYILTAAHVIGRPDQIATITFPDGKKVEATTLGVQNNIDSGMLKINMDQDEEFPYLDIGLSDDLNLGQWVMAVGHPGGIDEDRGLVVRVGRIIDKTNTVLKTDCTLVGGDSGGPLLDMNGDVVGIHSRIGTQLWNNIHVPVDSYSENWDRLAKGIIIDGRAILGFNVVDDTNKVDSVAEKSAAEKAGLKKGDVIIEIGGVEVEDKEDIATAKNGLRPFMKTEIVVERDGEEKTLEMIVSDR